MDGRWVPFDPKNIPQWLECGQGNIEKPDVLIAPDQSFVCTVAGAEIVKSDRFGANCTVRFPRFIAYRKDKTCMDIMTMDGTDSSVND